MLARRAIVFVLEKKKPARLKKKPLKRGKEKGNHSPEEGDTVPPEGGTILVLRDQGSILRMGEKKAKKLSDKRKIPTTCCRRAKRSYFLGSPSSMKGGGDENPKANPKKNACDLRLVEKGRIANRKKKDNSAASLCSDQNGGKDLFKRKESIRKAFLCRAGREEWNMLATPVPSQIGRKRVAGEREEVSLSAKTSRRCLSKGGGGRALPEAKTHPLSQNCPYFTKKTKKSRSAAVFVPMRLEKKDVFGGGGKGMAEIELHNRAGSGREGREKSLIFVVMCQGKGREVLGRRRKKPAHPKGHLRSSFFRPVRGRRERL